jgi:hypothetical protein
MHAKHDTKKTTAETRLQCRHISQDLHMGTHLSWLQISP